MPELPLSTERNRRGQIKADPRVDPKESASDVVLAIMLYPDPADAARRKDFHLAQIFKAIRAHHMLLARRGESVPLSEYLEVVIRGEKSRTSYDAYGPSGVAQSTSTRGWKTLLDEAVGGMAEHSRVANARAHQGAVVGDMLLFAFYVDVRFPGEASVNKVTQAMSLYLEEEGTPASPRLLEEWLRVYKPAGHLWAAGHYLKSTLGWYPSEFNRFLSAAEELRRRIGGLRRNQGKQSPWLGDDPWTVPVGLDLPEAVVSPPEITGRRLELWQRACAKASKDAKRRRER